MSDWDALLKELAIYDHALGFCIDLTSMAMTPADLETFAAAMDEALAAMKELEGGAIANPDEGRRVGHYWLRDASLAPAGLGDDIRAALEQTKALASQIRERFEHAVIVGIGGSSLGPQLVYDALGGDGLSLSFWNNTDPDGFDRLALDWDKTVAVVISKSGGTKETRNGMLELRRHCRSAVAITSAGSKLDQFAKDNGFIGTLPMWDWVGGRTSVTSAVGLFPAALQGADIDALLAGAAAMDALTRKPFRQNPAALLAAAWKHAARSMVMLPYKDRLELMSKYLQQLVMESLGKDGKGIVVYGNKGSTDQHAYVQQLYDGPDDFFVTFIEVLKARAGAPFEVEPGVSSGDYLSGFLSGTRRALADRGRRSLTITIDEVNASSMGALIALYERAVGLYATLIGVNAYHQPAVESGKKAASAVLSLQAKILDALGASPQTPAQIAASIDADPDATFRTLRHLCANARIACTPASDAPPWLWNYHKAT